MLIDERFSDSWITASYTVLTVIPVISNELVIQKSLMIIICKIISTELVTCFRWLSNNYFKRLTGKKQLLHWIKMLFNRAQFTRWMKKFLKVTTCFINIMICSWYDKRCLFWRTISLPFHCPQISFSILSNAVIERTMLSWPVVTIRNVAWITKQSIFFA